MSRCLFIPINVMVSEEYRLAQDALGMRESLHDVGQRAMQEHNRKLTALYHDLLEARREQAQADDQAAPRDA